MFIPIGVDGGVGSGSGIMVGPKLGISAFSRSACKCRFLKYINYEISYKGVM